MHRGITHGGDTIPTKGAWGATIATLVTQLLAALAHIVVAQKKYRLRVEVKDMARLLAFTLGCAILVIAVRYVPVNWLVQLTLATGLSAALFFALQIVPVNAIKSLLAKRGLS